MTSPEQRIGFGAFAFAVAFAACGSFGAKDDAPAGDAGAASDGAADTRTATDGGATDGGPKTCGSSRARALRCGSTAVCDAGESCCANGSDERFCLAGNCIGTKMDCQGNADCPPGYACCQAGTFIGSQCQTACEPDKLRYCYSSDECDAGEGCVPFDDAGFGNVWRCAPCP